MLPVKVSPEAAVVRASFVNKPYAVAPDPVPFTRGIEAYVYPEPEETTSTSVIAPAAAVIFTLPPVPSPMIGA